VSQLSDFCFLGEACKIGSQKQTGSAFADIITIFILSGCYYLFRFYRPNEKANAWVWGAVTDFLSVYLVIGWLVYGLIPEESMPHGVREDTLAQRHWDMFLARILAPVGLLWFWGLAVGTGYTASLFSMRVVVEWLAPASYNMFLFHQPVTEWYYLATRGQWWAYPKDFFWFRYDLFPLPFSVLSCLGLCRLTR